MGKFEAKLGALEERLLSLECRLDGYGKRAVEMLSAIEHISDEMFKIRLTLSKINARITTSGAGGSTTEAKLLKDMFGFKKVIEVDECGEPVRTVGEGKA